jgi:hypothetical protein
MSRTLNVMGSRLVGGNESIELLDLKAKFLPARARPSMLSFLITRWSEKGREDKINETFSGRVCFRGRKMVIVTSHDVPYLSM